jgi:hypothetical protein
MPLAHKTIHPFNTVHTVAGFWRGWVAGFGAPNDTWSAEMLMLVGDF